MAYETARKSMELALGSYQKGVDATLKRLEAERFAERLWNKDASLWAPDKETQDKIRNRFGWLNAHQATRLKYGELDTFAGEIVEAAFTHVVLLGMGGSSLAPELIQKIFGRAKNGPELIVLDSSDPGAVAAIESKIRLGQTLFIVSSKSGTTIETHSLLLYFYGLVSKEKGEGAGCQFIAITDAGSPLEKTAKEFGFRRVFLAPSDVAGRYSALTCFGMVPTALNSVDVLGLVDRAMRIARDTSSDTPVADNAGVLLGVAMAELAKAGRDKLTLIVPPKLAPLGDWIEQLLAESTGKEGKGILPIAREPEVDPKFYGDDRFFVFFELDNLESHNWESRKEAICRARHPAVTLKLRDLMDLGAQFFLWEFATAVSGAVLGINPFDEPNVVESKNRTKELLDFYAEKGKLPEVAVTHSADEVSKLQPALTDLLLKSKPGDYVALMAYACFSDGANRLLRSMQELILRRWKLASTLGFGPRFLHSTGQWHKGGPNCGLFIQFVHHPSCDRVIPNRPYSFEILKQAQALGDFETLQSKGRRIVRVEIKGDLEEGLRSCYKLLEKVAAG